MQPVIGDVGLPDLAREVRPGEVRRIRVALDLGQCDRRFGDAPRGERDAVEGVLPALVGEPAVGGALVLDEPVAVAIAVLAQPFEGAVGVGQQRVDLLARDPPAAQLAQQHDEQRRRVGGAVIDVAGSERQRRADAGPHLVQDAAGLLLGQRVDLLPLERREGLQRAERQRLVERQQHPGGQQ